MLTPRPLYVMAKPTPETAVELDRCRRELGMVSDYGRERFHTTILPIADAREAPSDLVDLLDAAFAAMIVGPCPILFDRLHGNALRGGGALQDLRDLQRMLVRHLTAMGVRLPRYLFRPHLSLTYGTAPQRTIAIPPVGWQVHEMLLIKSIHGEGRHETLARFPLVPRQGSFDF
jgi:2'-5' RNA ligase